MKHPPVIYASGLVHTHPSPPAPTTAHKPGTHANQPISFEPHNTESGKSVIVAQCRIINIEAIKARKGSGKSSDSDKEALFSRELRGSERLNRARKGMDMKSHGYEYEVVAKQKWMFYGELC